MKRRTWIRVRKSRHCAPSGKAWRVHRVRLEVCPEGSGVTEHAYTLAAFYDQPAALRYALKTVGLGQSGRLKLA